MTAVAAAGAGSEVAREGPRSRSQGQTRRGDRRVRAVSKGRARRRRRECRARLRRVAGEGSTRKPRPRRAAAIAHAPKGAYLHDPNGRARGAALYNLGLIQEAQGKPKDAATSYKDSQASRPSRVVREKLQKLDPVVAAIADPLAPVRLAGPFKDIRELCRAWLKKVGEDEDSTWGEGAQLREARRDQGARAATSSRSHSWSCKRSNWSHARRSSSRSVSTTVGITSSTRARATARRRTAAAPRSR